MIKHHPKFELIEAFVAGDLPASLSAGIAMHAQMCAKCKQQIAQLTEQIAETSFEHDVLASCSMQNQEDSDSYGNFSGSSSLSALNFDDMIAQITESDAMAEPLVELEKTVLFNHQSYVLPKALQHMALGKTANIGKLSRARIQLNENEIHTSLLQIQPGGGVPEHTHKGFELTLLLEGSFSDEQGDYVKGDFIMLDGSHQHNPVSEQGCLCYTVANAALHFTQGINKLLNPIGTFIY